MRASPIVAGLAAALLLPLAAGNLAAQEEEESAYIYASYYQCGPGLGEAVAILRDQWGPLVQTHMDAGHMAAWGVITHDTGNPWSLAVYHVGADLPTLHQGLNDALAQFSSTAAEAVNQFSTTCPTHEDYIWVTGPGSEPGAELAQERASAGMSVYWVCDEGREAVADLIVENVYAPIYDKQVQEGRLTSWGWLSHFVGGKYRRAMVMDGADHATLLDARSRIIEEINATSAALSAEFADICNGHSDVMWNIAVSQP